MCQPRVCQNPSIGITAVLSAAVTSNSNAATSYQTHARRTPREWWARPFS
jgi:hypothetical protein